MDKFQEIHGKGTPAMESSCTVSSRGPSPSRPPAIISNAASNINSQGPNGSNG